MVGSYLFSEVSLAAGGGGLGVLVLTFPMSGSIIAVLFSKSSRSSIPAGLFGIVRGAAGISFAINRGTVFFKSFEELAILHFPTLTDNNKWNEP